MFRKLLVAIFMTIGGIAIAGVGCYWSDSDTSDNLPPEINGFKVDGEYISTLQVREHSETSIAAVIWDGDGDAIQDVDVTWESSDGTLLSSNPEPYGPIVRFKAPAVDWETVEEPVMVTVTVTVTDGESDPVTRTLDVEVIPPCPPDDEHLEPVVESFELSAEMIDLGDRVTITLNAYDPEGADLTFEWFPPFGYIEGEGNSVDWVTTDVCCTAYYDIEYIVSDGCKEIWGYVSVFVNV